MRVYDLAELERAFPFVIAMEEAARTRGESAAERTATAVAPRPALAPAGLDELLASIGPGRWHEPMVRVVAKLVGRGWSDEDIQALAEPYTLPGYTVAQTRHEVQAMIDSARRKGFGAKAKVQSGRLKDDVPPAYPAEPLAAAEASARLRSAIERWFEDGRAFAQARRDLKGMRDTLYGPDFLSQVRAELVHDGILPAPLEEVPELMSRHERRIRAREWRKLKKRLLEERGLSSLSRGPRLAIQAAAGLGKTAEVVRYIMAHPELWRLHIWIFVPSLDLAEQLRANFGPGPYVRVMRGRLAKTPWEPQAGKPTTMCFLTDAAELAGNLGLNIYRTICKRGEDRCFFYDECPWIAQWNDTAPGIRIFAHEYLFLPKLPQLHKPDLVLIDESFIEAAVGRVNFLPDRLVEPAPWKIEEIAAALASLRTALEGDKPLLAALREAGVSKRDVALALGAAEAELDDSGVTPGMGEAEAVKRLSALEESERVKIARALRQLVLEFDLPRELCHALHLRRNMPVRVNGIIERQNRVVVAHRRKLILPSRVPVLWIDADADADIGRRVLGSDLAHVHIPVERKAEVVQCWSSTFSRQSLVGFAGASRRALAWAEKRLAAVKRFIEQKAGEVPVLAVTNLPVRRKLTGEDEEKLVLAFEWGQSVISHFGRIRGIDEWKDRGAVIVIGREQPPPEEIETLARGLYCDDPEALGLTGAYLKALRGYRLKGGRLVGVEVDVHGDPRVQRVLELKRERESAQAVDRVRLVHCDRPKLVFLLSNLPLDIDVDRLVSWRELLAGGDRLELALQLNGWALPLVPSCLARRWPDLFPTPRAAEMEIARKLKANRDSRLQDSDLRKSQIGIYWLLSRSKFRPASQGNGGHRRWSEAVLAADTPHFRARVREAMGCELVWEQRSTGKVYFKVPSDRVVLPEPSPAQVTSEAEKGYPASWDEVKLTAEEAGLWEPGMDSEPWKGPADGAFAWPEESMDADPGKVSFMSPAEVRPAGPLNGESAA